MSKPIKLRAEEVKMLEVIRLRRKAVSDELSDIGHLRLKIKRKEEKVEEFDDNTRQMEKDLAKDLEVKYGRGSIDTETGTFTPIT
tara:strand:- start:648 stop:902 length:255 start_codon:yes stop_codon:yes gene_type:complete